MTDTQTWLLVGAIVCTYFWLCRNLVVLVEPLRLSMIDDVEKMELDTTVTDDECLGAQFMLDTTYSWWPLLMLTLALPALALWQVVRLWVLVFVRRRKVEEVPETTKAKTRLLLKAVISWMAANPLLGLIFFCSVLASLLILLLAGLASLSASRFVGSVTRLLANVGRRLPHSRHFGASAS